MLIANLVGQIAIVLTGGLVRLTGSGLGCSTWPQCEPGYFTPQYHAAVTFHPYVEYGNRMVSVLVVIFATVAAILVWTTYSRSKQLRTLGLMPIILTFSQAIIGGITVLVKLHPAIVGGHLLISMILIAVSTYLLYRWDEGDGAPAPLVPRPTLTMTRVVALLTIPMLVLGVIVTGAGPHSGDTEVGYRFALDPLIITRFHALSVWLFLGALALTAVMLLRNRNTPARTRRALFILFGVTVLQGGVGYIQYFTGLPAAVVAAHMLLAALVTMAVTQFVLTARIRP